jgi:hypothetical protein
MLLGKRWFAIAALAIVLSVPRPSAAIVNHTPATPAPKCAASIPVVMAEKVTSDQSIPDQYFRFITVASTRFGSLTVAKGLSGYGIVRNVTAAGRRDVYGSVTLEPRYIVLGRGKRLDVTMDPTIPVALTSRTPTVDQYASHIPIPVPGIAMSAVNLVRFGKNVTLGPGFPFKVVPLFDPTHNPGC